MNTVTQNAYNGVPSILENSLPLYLQIFLLSNSILFYWDSNYKYVIQFDIDPLLLNGLFYFFKHLFPLCISVSVVSILLLSSSLILFLAVSNLLRSLSK